MPYNQKRPKLARNLIYVGVVMGLCQSNVALAQANNGDDIEEVVVTGSFIRNSSFNGASPVDTLTAESIQDSATVNVGEYMRDLTYTHNTDSVSNVLGGPGGGQDGNTAGFNLRGLGGSSTLTLLDGSRVVSQEEVGSLLPSIALARMEVVLDGGAALYGADAVAGVVNIIPIKQYDGFKFRNFYGRDDGGDYEEFQSSVLYGTSWDNFNLVVAAEATKHTPLMRPERSEFLAMDNDLFEDGPASTWTALDGSNPNLVDPSCGTFNQGNDVKGKNGAFPSGRLSEVRADTFRCIFNYGQWIQYKRPAQEYDLWANLTWQTFDWLETELQFGYNQRLSTFRTEPISPVSAAWKPFIIFPGNHPANPWGQDVAAQAVRFFSGYGQGPGTTPSYVQNGSQEDDYTYTTDRTKLSFRYDIGNTSWSGETALTYQTRRTVLETYEPLTDHLLAAFNGTGGPNGNEYYNPLLSSDPRSPYYVQGVTNNSQEVVDWLFAKKDQEYNRDRLLTFDSYVTGELMENWQGPVQLALGVAARKFIDTSQPFYLQLTGNNYTTSLGAPGRGVPQKTYDQDYVRSVFMELEIPILDNLSAQVAARYEKFETLDIPTATPKYALRYQPIDSLAIRASYAEGFLAPAPSQIGALRLTSCGTERDGSDPITGTTLLGVESCNSPNPDLGVEESEIINFGFTWEPLDDLSLGIDYQVIKYDGRIVSPDSIDLVLEQFDRMLVATGLNRDTYDPTEGSADRALANAWLDANPTPLIVRDENRLPVLFVEVPENVESVTVRTFDYNARYQWSMDNLGDFTFTYRASYIDEYVFNTLDGSFVAAGFQNGQTAKAPPLPEWKTNVGLDWLRGPHRGHATLRYTSDIKFNDNAPITPFRDGLPETVVVRPTTVEGGYQLDLNYSYTFDSLWGFGENVVVGVNMNNAFDWKPDALPIPGGLETRLYDPFGRTVSLSLDFNL